MDRKDRKNTFIFVLKLSITLLILFFIFNKINIGKTWGILRDCRMTPFVTALVVGLVINVLLPYRWDIILTHMNIAIPFRNLVAYQFISLFFAQIMPSKVGGDVVRACYVIQAKHSPIKVSLSIFTDRFIGMFIFLFFNVFSIAIGWHIIPVTIIFLVVAMDLVIIACATLIFHAHMLKNHRLIKDLLQRFVKELPFDNIRNELNAIWIDRTFVRKILALSFVINIFYIYMFILCAQSIGIFIPIYNFIVFLPLIWTITFLPISLNGLGLKEYLIILMFQSATVTSEQALALGLISRVIAFIVAFLGGITYLVKRQTSAVRAQEKR